MDENVKKIEQEFIDETVAAASSSKARDFAKKFFKRPTSVLGLAIIVSLIILSFIGPYIAPYDFQAYDYMNTFAPPSAEHIFGTDNFGRDVYSRILVGTSLTLGTALSSVIVGAVIGTILGLLAGYYGGIIESLVMRFSDVLFSFPDILLAIAIVAILGPGIINVFIAVMVFTVPSFARMMRSATLSVKGALYVEAARSIGCRNGRILMVHVLPGTMHAFIVNFTMRIGSAIMAAASLSFLGFGADITEQPEWGAMLSVGRNYLSNAPHLVYFPGLCIFVTVLAFNLLGDGLRDTLDPKIK